MISYRAMAADNAKAIVLVVDDEQSTRELERRILETGPYQVLEAPGAAAAFAMLQGGQKLDLLIADLDMPEMTGEEMVMKVRTARPGLKVLYVSGVVDRMLATRTFLGDGEAFVDKPFTSRGLLEGVSLLLYGTLAPPER
jgi:two-component system cell cycle sensor histidine kinase/response regulator CckA